MAAYSFKRYFSKLCPHISTERHSYCAICLMSVKKGEPYCHGEENIDEFVTSKFKGSYTRIILNMLNFFCDDRW